MSQSWHKLCLRYVGDNHHIPVHFGPAPSVHGVPYPGGADPQEASPGTFAAHTK